ncbi:MAG: hypothetical protein JXD23_13820 [Spirochaetales bacterium]|nr:hypothetical protein [Spirochaetales bacterium]
MAAAVVLAVSILINILFFAGVLNPQPLIREKDEMIARFSERVNALEEKNRELRRLNDYFLVRIEHSQAFNSAAEKELDDIIDGYQKLLGDKQ